MKTLKVLLLVLIIAFIAIQFVPTETQNPPVVAEIRAPEEVMTILRRACYDCHSNETVWPWYSKVAPVSWLVAEDVEHGREELNFSEWGNLSRKEQSELAEDLWEEVDEGEMPLWFYVAMHSEAELTSEAKQVLHEWAEQVEKGE